MKKATLTILVLAVIPLVTVFGFGKELPQAISEDPPGAYLPLIYKQPTPTLTPTPIPTSTPTPIPTPRAQLQDGYYQADLPNNGQIWFTVSNNGTEAKNAGFIFQLAPWCPWGVYSFDGSKPIDNGGFGFVVVDFKERSLVASMGCTSISPSQASCSARQPMPGTTCGGMSGIATLR